MLAYRLIERKRDGGRIEPGEWRALVHAYASGHVADHQMAAFLMAVYLRGLDRAETRSLTEAMLGGGTPLVVRYSGLACVGEQSTGGVGDKVSLVLAPLVASLGVAVPMVLGPALAHTGSTLDKLESIPGFRTSLALVEARSQMERIGCVMTGAIPEMAPAEEMMSSLRDATATVESVPLMAASIMSRKLSEGLTGLVLDVKHGSGSLVPTTDDALELARLAISLGVDHGCDTVALLTAMDRPLGRAVGNALEMEEAIHALRGEGPPDLLEVTFALGAEMLMLARAVLTRDEAREVMAKSISSGAAARKFQEIVEFQGGNPAVVDDPSILPQAEACELYESPQRGFVARVEPRAVGWGVPTLSDGHVRLNGVGDPAAGFVISAKPGDWVELGEPLATIFASGAQGIAAGRMALREAIRVAEDADPPLPLVSHRVSDSGLWTFDQDHRYGDR